MFQAFKTFFRKTDIRGNGEKNGSNPVHFHQTLNWQPTYATNVATKRLQLFLGTAEIGQFFIWQKKCQYKK
jgi:hypothetical protein